MADVTISTNAAQLAAAYARRAGAIDTALRAGMTDATTYALRIMKTYPPARANSTYKRTNTLKGSWSRRIEGSATSLRGIVGSNGYAAPYNRRVQDAARQAPVHRGRWLTIQSFARRHGERVNRFFHDRVSRAIHR